MRSVMMPFFDSDVAILLIDVEYLRKVGVVGDGDAVVLQNLGTDLF